MYSSLVSSFDMPPSGGVLLDGQFCYLLHASQWSKNLFTWGVGIPMGATSVSCGVMVATALPLISRHVHDMPHGIWLAQFFAKPAHGRLFAGRSLSRHVA